MRGFSLDMVTICVAYLSYTLYMVKCPTLDGVFYWQSYARLVGMYSVTIFDGGVWYLYSALTTHLRCENPPVSITIYGGN